MGLEHGRRRFAFRGARFFGSRHLGTRSEQELAENVKDARDSDGVVVDESAIRASLSLARVLAPFLIPSASLKSGAFAEDDGCVALVVQSLATGRRLTCRVSTDGNTVRVIRIDENMKSEVSHMSLGDEKRRASCRWVLARALRRLRRTTPYCVESIESAMCVTASSAPMSSSHGLMKRRFLSPIKMHR